MKYVLFGLFLHAILRKLFLQYSHLTIYYFKFLQSNAETVKTWTATTMTEFLMGKKGEKIDNHDHNKSLWGLFWPLTSLQGNVEPTVHCKICKILWICIKNQWKLYKIFVTSVI